MQAGDQPAVPFSAPRTLAAAINEINEVRGLLHDEDTKVSLVSTVKKIVARSHERARYLRLLMRKAQRLNAPEDLPSSQLVQDCPKEAFKVLSGVFDQLFGELDRLRKAANRKVDETDADIGGKRALARFAARVNELCNINALNLQIDPNGPLDVMLGNLAEFFANERNATLALHTSLGEARRKAARATRLLEDTRDADVVKMREERDAALAARDTAQTRLAELEERERTVCEERDELHRRIGAISAERDNALAKADSLSLIDSGTGELKAKEALPKPEEFTGLRPRYADQACADVMGLVVEWGKRVGDFHNGIEQATLPSIGERSRLCDVAYDALHARVRELAHRAYPVKSDLLDQMQRGAKAIERALRENRVMTFNDVPILKADTIEPLPPVQKATRDVLQEAQAIVDGARRKDYGHPAENHARTAQLFSTYLGHTVTAEQVCMLNILQKVSRFVHGGSRDNLVDIAGYARNVELIREKNGTQGAD